MQELEIDKSLSKEEKYKTLYNQVDSLISINDSAIANLGNVIAAIHHTFNFLWTGIYFVAENQLTLGIFQGTTACTRIPFGKGVCGACYSNRTTIIVDDVNRFDGHIACSSLSKSEIVLPIFDNENKVIAVFDIDSEHLNSFDQVDKKYLEKILESITPYILQFAQLNY